MVADTLNIVYNVEGTSDIFCILIAKLKRIYFDEHRSNAVVKVVYNLLHMLNFIVIVSLALYKVVCRLDEVIPRKHCHTVNFLGSLSNREGRRVYGQ